MNRLSSQASHRTTTFSAICLTLVWLLSACVAPGPAATSPKTETATATGAASFPLTITDAAGQKFTFDKPPKIGCWWTGCTEVLADLGVAPQAAGTWLPEGFDSKLFFPAGPPPHEIKDYENPEPWAAAEVDLLIMRLPVSPAQDALKTAAPIFYLHAPSYGKSSQTGYQAYLENLHLGGQLTGKPAAANAAIARFETMLTNLKKLATPETRAQKVALLWEDDAYRAIDNTNPFCTIIAEAGLGACIEAPLWEEISPETFLAEDPDLILYMSGTNSYKARTDPVWSQLSAVKAGKVYGVTGLYYCCGARTMYHDLHEYVHLILPDALPDPGPFAAYDPEQSPLVTTGATDANKAPFPVTVTDAVGKEFTFDAAPKIGCQFYGCYETLSDLGVTPQAASGGGSADRGANFYTPGPEPLHVIGDFQNPELWAAAEVDLIGVSAPADPSYDALAQAAPVFHLYYTGDKTLMGHAAFTKNLEMLGQVTGKSEAAAAALARFEKMEAKLHSLATPTTAKLKIALLRSRDTYQLFGPGTAFCTVLVEVGLGECLGEGDFLTDLNAEQLLALNPDWIIYVTNKDSYKDRTDPVWAQLKAVKEGRVYDTITNRYGCCSLRALYLPFQEYVAHVLPAAGAPAVNSTADYNPEDNWLVNP